jgi:hypothetical protein
LQTLQIVVGSATEVEDRRELSEKALSCKGLLLRYFKSMRIRIVSQRQAWHVTDLSLEVKMWRRVLGRCNPFRALRIELENARSKISGLAAERDAYLRERDEALGERNAFLRQRDEALGERNAFLRQRDEALGERNEFLRQRDEALGERNEFLHQRDNAIGECNEIVRQLDAALGQRNFLSDRVARHVHRADIAALRGSFRPAAATRDRILLFLHLAKTGGVTLADIFARNLATRDFLVMDMSETDPSGFGTWSHVAIEKALGRMQQSEIDDVRFVWGHFRHGIQAHLPKPCAGATLLREPLDRVVSHYYYWDGSARGEAKTLDDYLSADHPHCPLFIDNYMTRILSGVSALDPAQGGATTESHPRVSAADFEIAANNLDSYIVVGLTEQFDETLLVLGVDLCWSLSDLVYSVLNVTKSRPAVAEIPESVRNTILDWNRFDTALVERARAHLARRIASYPGDFQKDLALFWKLNALFCQGVAIEELRRIEHESRSKTPEMLDGYLGRKHYDVGFDNSVACDRLEPGGLRCGGA